MQTNVYVKEFSGKEEAMAFKRDKGVSVHIYDDTRWLYMSIDEYYDGEQLPLESLDTSLLFEDKTDPLAIKQYRYMRAQELNPDVAPVEHNYVIGLTTKLFPERHFVQGELQCVHWYANEDLTDVVLEINVAYERDLLGFATRRVTTREWFREDGTKSIEKKVSVKVYDDLAQIEEGVRRRGNLIKGLMKPVLGLMIMTMAVTHPELSQPEIVQLGRDFIKKYKVEFTAFVDDSNPGILNDIANATDDWLDNDIGGGVTIRHYMMNEINIYE